jgi:hypothetical protein
MDPVSGKITDILLDRISSGKYFRRDRRGCPDGGEIQATSYPHVPAAVAAAEFAGSVPKNDLTLFLKILRITRLQ